MHWGMYVFMCIQRKLYLIAFNSECKLWSNIIPPLQHARTHARLHTHTNTRTHTHTHTVTLVQPVNACTSIYWLKWAITVSQIALVSQSQVSTCCTPTSGHGSILKVNHLQSWNNVPLTVHVKRGWRMGTILKIGERGHRLSFIMNEGGI